MINSIQMHTNRNKLRHSLLATVSATALIVSVSAAQADGTDDGHPIVWIEAGGAFDQLGADDTLLLPPNAPASQTNPTPSFGTLPKVGYDADFKLSFTPNDSDWIFSVGLIYGRALRGHKSSHDQGYNVITYYSGYNYKSKYKATNWNFINTQQRSSVTHLILDFQAGKDVGLGMFSGKSTLNVGIRVAKLNENVSGHLTAATGAASAKYDNGEVFHVADFVAKHSFTGLGPSLSWDATVPFAGNLSDGLSFDWGINAALLFGKQRAHATLRTRDTRYYYSTHTVIAHSTESPSRTKNILVPNIGGFAGISWRLPNAKVSIGYKADFFFSAIDGGNAVADDQDLAFRGPYASISIGLGSSDN